MVSNSGSTITVAGLSLPLTNTLGRPVCVGEAIRVCSNAAAVSIAIARLSVPLAKTAKLRLINVSAIATGADSIGGELAIVAIEAGHPLVASAIPVAGLGLPLAKTLRRPVLIGGTAVAASVAAVAVVGRVGEGAGREGEDEDLKHSTFTNPFFSFKTLFKTTYNLSRHDLAR